MPFNWNEYFTLGKALATAKEEAKLRSAISRSYYCAYNSAKAFLVKKRELAPRQKIGHKDLWDKFPALGLVSVKSYGERIRESRNKADYDDDVPKLQAEVTSTLINVQMILNQLK